MHITRSGETPEIPSLQHASCGMIDNNKVTRRAHIRLQCTHVSLREHLKKCIRRIFNGFQRFRGLCQMTAYGNFDRAMLRSSSIFGDGKELQIVSLSTGVCGIVFISFQNLIVNSFAALMLNSGSASSHLP